MYPSATKLTAFVTQNFVFVFAAMFSCDGGSIIVLLITNLKVKYDLREKIYKENFNLLYITGKYVKLTCLC